MNYEQCLNNTLYCQKQWLVPDPHRSADPGWHLFHEIIKMFLNFLRKYVTVLLFSSNLFRKLRKSFNEELNCLSVTTGTYFILILKSSYIRIRFEEKAGSESVWKKKVGSGSTLSKFNCQNFWENGRIHTHKMRIQIADHNIPASNLFNTGIQ